MMHAYAKPAGNGPGARPPGILQPGTPAPDFGLPTTPDQRIRLRDFRGRRVILAFYPADWSPVCGDQMVLYNELLPEFKRHNAELLGASVDGVWCHIAFAKHNRFGFPLLADFEPKGEAARAYGVYRDHEGISERALFVIDEQGIIHWSYLSPIGVNPGADGILAALEELDSRQASDGSLQEHAHGYSNQDQHAAYAARQ
jgi:peroxiredoxin